MVAERWSLSSPEATTRPRSLLAAAAGASQGTCNGQAYNTEVYECSFLGEMQLCRSRRAVTDQIRAALAHDAPNLHVDCERYRINVCWQSLFY